MQESYLTDIINNAMKYETWIQINKTILTKLLIWKVFQFPNSILIFSLFYTMRVDVIIFLLCLIWSWAGALHLQCIMLRLFLIKWPANIRTGLFPWSEFELLTLFSGEVGFVCLVPGWRVGRSCYRGDVLRCFSRQKMTKNGGKINWWDIIDLKNHRLKSV